MFTPLRLRTERSQPIKQYVRRSPKKRSIIHRIQTIAQDPIRYQRMTSVDQIDISNLPLVKSHVKLQAMPIPQKGQLQKNSKYIPYIHRCKQRNKLSRSSLVKQSKQKQKIQDLKFMLDRLRKNQKSKILVMSLDEASSKRQKKELDISKQQNKEQIFSKKKFLPKIIKWSSIKQEHKHHHKINSFNAQQLDQNMHWSLSKDKNRQKLWPLSQNFKKGSRGQLSGWLVQTEPS